MKAIFKLTLVSAVIGLTLTACGDDKSEHKAAAPVAAASNAAATAVGSAATAVGSAAGSAVAAVTKDKNGCIAYPKDQLMNIDVAKAKLVEMGYKVKSFEVNGNCYEMYGFDKEGKKAEIYFDAKTMDVVKKGD